MSLFENELYRWRETYFVFFDRENRPSAERVERSLTRLGSRYQVTDLRADPNGLFESLTLISPDDYSAMDVTFLTGEEVLERGTELARELESTSTTKNEREKLRRLVRCDSRLDIYHFERLVAATPGDEEEEDEDEFLDPSALLIVLEKLAKICCGIGVDPQSGTLM